MPIPPKKLKAFADADSKKKKPPFGKGDDEEEKDEGAEDEGGDEKDGADEGKGGKKGNPFGKKKGNPGGKGDEGGEEKHLSPEETQALLEKAEAEVENGPDGSLVEAMGGYDGSGDVPPGFDEATWEAASEIVGPEDYQGDADPWLVVAHVYKHLGGKVEGGGEGGDEQPEQPEGGDEG